MNKIVEDSNGIEYLTDDGIGAEYDDRYSSLISKVNLDVIFDEAKISGKSISVLQNEKNIANISFNNADVVLIEFGYGGTECYVKNSPENEILLSSVRSLEEYPCLDDERLSCEEKKMVQELVSCDDFIFLIEEQLTREQKKLLSDIYYQCNFYGDLSSCPVYDNNLFNQNDIITKDMLVAFVGKDIDKNSLSLTDFDTMEISEENKNSIMKNMEALQSWYSQKFEQNVSCQPEI